MKMKWLLLGLVLLMMLPLVSATLNDFTHGYNLNATLDRGADYNLTLNLTLRGTVTGNNSIYQNGSNFSNTASHSNLLESNTTTWLSNSELTSNWTISLWTYVTTTTADQYILSGATGATGTSWSLVAYNGGCGNKVLWSVYDGASKNSCATSASSAWSLNTWKHILISYNGSNTISFYIDGVFSNSLSVSYGTTSRCGNSAGVGGYNYCGTYSVAQSYTGMVDELYIYNRSLTQAEITLLATKSTYPINNLTAPANNVSNVSILVTNFYNGSYVIPLNVTATNSSGYVFNGSSTNGSIYQWDAPLYNNGTSLMNIIINSFLPAVVNTTPTNNLISSDFAANIIYGSAVNTPNANDNDWTTYANPDDMSSVSYFWNYTTTTVIDNLYWKVKHGEDATNLGKNVTLVINSSCLTNTTTQLKINVTRDDVFVNYITFQCSADGYNWVTVLNLTSALFGNGGLSIIFEQGLTNVSDTYPYLRTYFERQLINQNISSLITTTLTQNIITFIAKEKITNFTLSAVNFTTPYLTNTTHYMANGTYNVIANKTGYYNISQSVTASYYTVRTVTIENMSSSILNLTMKDNITNATITTFGVWLNNSYWNYSVYMNTTNGSIVVPLLNSTWVATIDDSTHAISSTTFGLLNNSVTNITIYASTTNIIYFYVYDEVTRALINYTTVNIELIGNYNSYNQTTTNGTWFKSLITPDVYTIRTTASGYNQRFYYFELTNRSTNVVLLYLLNASAATNITVTIIDLSRGGALLENAFVYVQKYNVATNTYITREILNTNFEGTGQFSAQFNTEFYKFIVQYPLGNTLTETTPAYITSTSLTIPVSTAVAASQTWQTVYGISGDVSYNPNTNNFRFAYTDPSLSIDNACLYVYRMRNNLTTTLINSSCTTAHSATILLNVQNLTLGSYFAKGTVFLGTTEYIIDTEEYSFNNMLLWGTLGIFLSALIAIVMQMMFKNPIASLIVTPLPTLAFTMAGITALPTSAVIGLCIICWTAAVLAAKWA